MLPIEPLDVSRTYSGRWYELARTHANEPAGCSADVRLYAGDPDTGLVQSDTCLLGGRVRHRWGPVDILNPGVDTRTRVRYRTFGAFYVPRTFRVTAHGPRYRWMVVVDETDHGLQIFTRAFSLPEEERARILARVAEAGIDVRRLRFPERLATPDQPRP